MEIHYQVIP